MFAVAERDRVRRCLLDRARSDPAITGAAVTGSHVSGGADRWSDIDLVFAVDGPLKATLHRWTEHLYRDFGAVHHWDLPSGATVYRVFLLPDWLEVDIGFAPEADFGPRGPAWRTVFGADRPPSPAPRPDTASLVGRGWHHVRHAHACIERRRWWQAEHWISAARDQVLALACLRLGRPAWYAKGAHLLPAELTGPLQAALVRSLEEAELRRALAAAAGLLAEEVARTDPELAARLVPMLTELGAVQPSPARGRPDGA